MSLTKTLIAELTQEAANTRKVLERIPMDKADWKPHHMSMTLGRLATHIAEIPEWITMMVNADELDFAKMDLTPKVAASVEELLATHDRTVADAVKVLENATDEDLDKLWTMRTGDHVHLSLPKRTVIRTFAFSHLFHHRGQLTVYLRLQNVPLSYLYGPTADELAAMAAAKAN